jgi:hypothetical protein
MPHGSEARIRAAVEAHPRKMTLQLARGLGEPIKLDLDSPYSFACSSPVRQLPGRYPRRPHEQPGNGPSQRAAPGPTEPSPPGALASPVSISAEREDHGSAR